MLENLNLPPLWTTECQETSAIELSLRFTCKWHGLTWYPIEYDPVGGVAYGLTTHIVPTWRHFNVRELSERYGNAEVVLDRGFIPGRVPLIREVALYCLDDLTPFLPLPVQVPGLPDSHGGL